MKNFKQYLGYAIMLAVLFTSCSKDNESLIDDPGNETASISFATVLNDLVDNKALKDHLSDFPACSDEAPAYVEVVLTGMADVGTMADPLVVNVSPTPGDYDEDGEEEYFTEESSELELEPGSYTLEHFAVYDANDVMIWVAPKTGGSLANFVDNPLPLDIELGAGVKKYVDVEVLCFDDRVVNEYGYLFFDLDSVEAIEFCFFANFCDENGRHFPAALSVDIWLGTDDSGAPLYSGTPNMVGTNNNDEPYANPVCFALPDLEAFDDDEDYLYYEVTLQDWEGVYGDVEQSVISGTLSRNDIEANFVGEDNVDYEHLRFGCGDDDDNGEEPEEPMDSDDDGIPDAEDNCPEMANPDQTDTDQDGVGDVCDECPEEAGEGNNGCPEDGEILQPCVIEDPAADCTSALLEGETGYIEVTDDLPLDLYVGDEFIGTFTLEVTDDGDVVIGSELTAEGGYLWSGYQVYLSTSNESSDIFATLCNIVDATGMFNANFGIDDAAYPVYVQIEANVCPAADEVN